MGSPTEVDFELTLDDFAQALSAHHTVNRNRGTQERTNWWFLGIVFLAALLGLAIIIAPVWKNTIKAFDLQGIITWAAIPAPWVVLVLIDLSPHAARQWGRKGVVVVLGLLAVVGLAIAIPTLRILIDTNWLWLAWVIVASRWATHWQVYVQRTGVSWIWKHDRRLQGHKVLHWDGVEFSFADADSRLVYQWHALRGWQETPNVLLLYVSDIEFQIVPKRAFASSEQLSEFRKVLQDVTKVRQPGFPVISLAK